MTLQILLWRRIRPEPASDPVITSYSIHYTKLYDGVSEYNNSETLHKFGAWIEDGQVLVDEDEIREWARRHPQPYRRDTYQGAYQDPVSYNFV